MSDAPGDLAERLAERTRAALASGAMQPIATEQAVIAQAGVDYLVRVVSSLARKEADRRRREGDRGRERAPIDPFLPPEPELRVADIPPAHVAVLNKFNVLDRHLLIVTRGFEYQETLLTPQDFQALFACMTRVDGLGFYNGGALAGASQPHKHLQLVPLPLAPHGPAFPTEPLLQGAGPQCGGLPFAHVLGRLSRPVPEGGAGLAAEAHALYRRCLADLGIQAIAADGGERQSAPYNLLAARDWLLLVPRVAESFEDISVNALGFAGSLFVRAPAQLERIRAIGPAQVLVAVAGPS